MKRPLIFNVGLPRAGTASLEEALGLLGWRPVHKTIKPDGPEAASLIRASDAAPLRDLEADYDAFLDIPFIWHSFPRLDGLYPGSRFIFCWREKQEWIDSRTRLAEQLGPGCWGPDSDREQWPGLYDSWLDRVHRYFRGRSDFLEMRICDGEGWERLCAFLDVPVPRISFPHVNRTDRG